VDKIDRSRPWVFRADPGYPSACTAGAEDRDHRGIVCHFLPPQYQLACRAVAKLCGVSADIAARVPGATLATWFDAFYAPLPLAIVLAALG